MKRDPFLFETRYGLKSIELIQGDITALNQSVNIIAFSAFKDGYKPTPKTIVKALADKGTKVWELLEKLALDLRNSQGVWLSKELNNSNIKAERVACIETIWGEDFTPELVKNKLKSLYGMLAAAEYCGINIGTIAIPLFGGHHTSVDHEFMLTSMMKESKSALESIKSFESVAIVIFNERDYELAEKIFDRVLGRTDLSIAEVSNEVTLVDLKDKLVGDINSICEMLPLDKRKDAYLQRDIINDIYNQKGHSICMAARKLLEIMINNLYLKYRSYDNTSLLEKIKFLDSKIKFPKIINSYMHVVRIVGNHSAHIDINEDGNYNLSAEDIRIMVAALTAFTRYYRNLIDNCGNRDRYSVP